MPASLRPVRYLTMTAFALLTSSALGVAKPADKIGVVLLHGELGAPARVIDGLAQTLQKAGYLVGTPDMCWSARRGYEAPFDACLATIDDTIVRLTNLGATSIVVGGFSLGGNGAIAFGASHPGLLGVFAVAPAHDAREVAENPDIAESIARAQKLAAGGKGEETTSFADVVFGPAGAYTNEIATTPTIYLSFFGQASHADIADNARRLSVPLLWVAGKEDPTQRGGAEGAFADVPANALNRYVAVASPHQGTPEKSKEAVLAWLKDIAAAKQER
jgi:esterase/lipase